MRRLMLIAATLGTMAWAGIFDNPAQGQYPIARGVARAAVTARYGPYPRYYGYPGSYARSPGWYGYRAYAAYPGYRWYYPGYSYGYYPRYNSYRYAWGPAYRYPAPYYTGYWSPGYAYWR
jgi:hypothetical protein